MRRRGGTTERAKHVAYGKCELSVVDSDDIERLIEKMKVQNRAWVKNAAIIFLSVLLVLTFFSNTILNRSLPEVTGQTAYGGEISTAVRGKGTVTANEAYSLSVETSREITRVNVRVGDIVEAGQVLFELEPSDSSELEAALDVLKGMQYNYNHKILSLSKDYALEELQYTLEDALEQQEKSLAAAEALALAKVADETAQESLRLANEDIDELNDKITALTDEINSGLDEDLMDEDLKKKKLAVDHAKENYENALKDYNAANSGGGVTDLTGYIQAVADAQNAVGLALEEARQELIAQYPGVTSADTGLTGGALAYQNYLLEAEKGVSANAVIVNGLLVVALRHEDHAALTKVIAWKSAAQALVMAEEQLEMAGQGGANGPYIQQLKEYMEGCERAVKRAEKAWEDATTGIRVEAKQEREKLRAQMKTMQTALVPITKAAAAAADELKKAEANASVTPEAAADAVRLAQRAIERKMDELENSEALRDLELGRDREAIAEQQEVINKLRNKEIGTEVSTRYGGTVLSVDAMVGDKTVPGDTLATIEINGKGYTLTFSVSNEEVQRVRIGDIATISSWGRGDTVCTLSAIRTDRDNPTRRKILEFDVTGDNVIAGENLEISLGSRTQYHNYVVPNSAIREDADGKFVLIADAKQTPLGTRYIATRYEVTVVDQDTRNSAITGDFEWGPFVITTSSKPIEPNTQVRLV